MDGEINVTTMDDIFCGIARRQIASATAAADPEEREGVARRLVTSYWLQVRHRDPGDSPQEFEAWVRHALDDTTAQNE